MLKRILAVLGAASIAVLVGGAPSWAGEGQDEHVPVNVCHATSSDTNPYVFITVDDDSTKFKGHLMHREDPNKVWKSDIIWNGVAYTAGDPKPDLIGSYTDTAGTFFEYDGEINSIEDCGSVTLPPDPEVKTTVGDKMNCDGVFERTITTTREYEWNGEEFVLGEPVVVVGDWEFVRDLTKAEQVELGCVEPEPTVITVKQTKDNCDGIFVRTKTITTYPDGEVTTEFSKWVKTDSLTRDEKIDAGCITPEPKSNPEPPAPELPHTGGNGATPWIAGLGALLTALGSGMFWMTRRV